MTALYVITAVALVASLIASRRKTLQALKLAGRRFLRLLPAFLTMLCLVALALALLPRELLFRYLGGEGLWSTAGIAAVLGSVTLMPGFIAFPLSGLLLKEGAAYLVLAAFTTTLMMVGVVTFPVERQFMGTRVALLRNFISLLIALAVTAGIGLYFGELW
jgi:peptidoglycan/LPS O-acetylase OafA/YrhL